MMRYFPMAAGSSTHVPLAIVDELQSGTEVSVPASGKGSGTLILDVDVLEVTVSG